MAQINGNNLPPPQEPFVDADFSLSYSGYQYLLNALNLLASSQEIASVASGLIAAGNNQATALQLNSQWNEVDTVALGTGVLLSAFTAGQSQTVFNQGVNPLAVYPPPGSQIDALGDNASYALAVGAKITFDFISASQIRS